MDTKLVKISSNWTQIAGCEFSQSLQLKEADPDVFKRPTLDELVDQDKSVLLSKGDSTDNCELLIEIYPHYKIQEFSLVCNTNKLEIFQGHLKEYLETVYGAIVDESEDSDFKTYRYDVEVEKSGITELTLKFLTQSTEICLFGIVLQTAPNPNGITTLLPNSGAINIQNVQNLLKNSSVPLTPASEKCKQFLELMTKAKLQPLPKSPTNANIALTNATEGLPPSLQQRMQQYCNINRPLNMDIEAQAASNNDSSDLKMYIDTRLNEMEDRINQRLLQMEHRHMEKFDCLLKLVEKLNRN